MILITGANGLVGTDLVDYLANQVGVTNILATDITTSSRRQDLKTEILDVRDYNTMQTFVKKYSITQIYHLAGLLSVGGEKNPDLAWDINLNGLKNVLDLAKEFHLRVFWPSSIAVFGQTTPKINTPQHTILEPSTIYGATKVAGELLCNYYHHKYGVDVRSLRYPGLIAWKAPPGDGTTEYSVHIFHSALRTGRYDCFLSPQTKLPMMYIDDAVIGTVKLMSVSEERVSIRTSYNFSALDFSCEQLVAEIAKNIPLTITYTPDHRQLIADSWPQSVDDSVARQDWGWQPVFDLPRLVTTMLKNLSSQYVK